MAGQREALSYGHPDWGGIVIGGANLGVYRLMRCEVSDDPERRTISARVAVHGAANVAPFLAALGRQSGNLGHTAGTARTINCTTSTPSGGVNGAQEVQLTRQSGDSFATSDVGLPIALGGGTMAQISSVSSSSVAIASIIAGGSFSYGSGTIACTIGTAMVSCRDTERGGAPIKVGGIKARPTARRVSDGDDDNTRRLFDVTITYQRPAKELRTDDSTRPHIRSASVSREYDDAGLLSISFSGVLTAGRNSSDAGQVVYNLLTESVDAWITAQLASLASGRTMEQVGGGKDRWDEEEAILSFDRSYRELNEPDLSSATDDPRIKGAQYNYQRVYSNIHGIRGARNNYSVIANFSCVVPAKGASAVTPENVRSFWANTVKPSIVRRAKALMRGTPVIVRGSDPALDPVTNRLSGSLFLFMANSGSNIYSYSRTTRMQLSTELEISRIWDGEPMTYDMWSPGAKLLGFVDVSMVQVGAPRAIDGGGGNPLVDQAALGDLLGIFNLNESAIALSFVDLVQKKPSKNQAEYFPSPGDPSRFFGGAVPKDGAWVTLGLAAGDSPTFWGQDVDNKGNVVEITSYNFSAVYLYVRKTSRRAPKVPREPTRAGNRIPRTTTVERVATGRNGSVTS